MDNRVKRKYKAGGIVLIIVFILSFCLQAPASEAAKPAVKREPAQPKTAAVVIDDLGNNMKGTEDILALPFKVTVAVMPFLPSSKEDAEAAHRAGHDVIVHLPMEPLSGRSSWLGEGAIMVGLDDEEIRKRVHAALDDIPHAIGINNHMGSKATADERVMRIVLEVCRERGVFYLDSHTNYRSVVGQLAEELGVPSLDNQLFIDDVHTKRHMKRQMRLLSKQADQFDYAIAIGHVGGGGKMVAEVLKQWSEDGGKDIRLVGLSTLFAEQFPLEPFSYSFLP
ncbi:divergent polysaccharide deacetylase family protein [Paenibacillus senegalensis]|uniref:divergent polysaccharide deacetylase family protein n=1 Tax=Paenibacillus senegalensis TaxID=1465766 RepID=UPI000288D5FA|nr:divergent polysaccharide deacetylase family protein [Paenibacillus senegalensis]